jgi:acetylornithine deacetylase/succinyl-diaminopimelate desuccinylase-like protein
VSYEAFDKLVADRTKQWISELSDYCRIPCETAQLPELKRGAKWTADRLRTAGAKVEIIEKPGVAPLVVGEMGSGKLTLICVQHYDVQPAAPLELWTTPPYEPTIRDNKLYARGVSDNKRTVPHPGPGRGGVPGCDRPPADQDPVPRRG